MKEKYSSIQNEPALQGGNFQLDPSEEKVARKAVAQGQRPQAEIDRIIDYASKFEDAEAVERRHEFDDAVQKERARDPEHDW